jgi:hypothetical protein
MCRCQQRQPEVLRKAIAVVIATQRELRFAIKVFPKERALALGDRSPPSARDALAGPFDVYPLGAISHKHGLVEP